MNNPFAMNLWEKPIWPSIMTLVAVLFQRIVYFVDY